MLVDRTGPNALYRLYAEDDVLLYVGISHKPETRWVSHAGEKPWWRQVRRFEITWYPSREEAHAAEVQAMKDERPLYNIQDSPWRAARGPWGELIAMPKPAPKPKDPNRGTPKISFRVEPELWDAFKAVCAARRTNAAAALREFMMEDAAAHQRATGAAS